MLEINFKNDRCHSDKTHPPEEEEEETSACLLPDAKPESIAINSNAKSKTRSIRDICFKLNTYLLIILATFFVVLAILLFSYPLFDLLTTHRLRMLPNFPPFKLWAKPEPIVYCRAYIFTVTNADEFLNGIDRKLKVQELGPIVFREHLAHHDIEFHENSTLSYTIKRHLEFLPEMNEPGILNRTITVPNVVLLGMASKLADYMFTFKMAFNLISRDDKLFVNKTIYEYFWNFTTPALLTVDRYLPFMVPLDNGGVLYSVYKDFNDRVNVRIGPKYSAQEFFTINTFEYRPTVPGYRPERGECYADLMNSSEGAIYPNKLSRDTVLYYWRKTVCRPVPLYFEEEVMIGSLTGYKYVIHVDWYDRKENLTADCYKGFGKSILPDGLSDASKCYKDLPVAVSAPHFYGRTGGPWERKVEGFTPNREAHGSYTIVEPINGVPLAQVARSQSNFFMPKLTGFNQQLSRFSEMVVPLFWLEYHQPKLTPDITALLVFTSNILPRIEYVIPVIFLILALVLYWCVIRRMNRDFSLGGYSRIKLLWQREKVHFFENTSRSRVN